MQMSVLVAALYVTSMHPSLSVMKLNVVCLMLVIRAVAWHFIRHQFVTVNGIDCFSVVASAVGMRAIDGYLYTGNSQLHV